MESFLDQELGAPALDFFLLAELCCHLQVEMTVKSKAE